MPNAMPDASDSECCGDAESQREWEANRNLPVGGIRSCDQLPHGASLPGNGEAKVAVLCADAQDREGRRRPEIVAGSFVSTEFDYIGFPNAASSLHSQTVKKPDDRVLGKLGPKTKETELRLGLPEEAENNDFMDVTGSKRGPSMKTADSCVGLSMHEVRSTYPKNNQEAFRDSIAGPGGSIFQQPQFFSCEQSRFSKGVEPRSRGYSFQIQEELKQKPTIQEITRRELPFDIRYSLEQEKWSKPMMVIPPLNSFFRMADSGLDVSDIRRAKRVFSDTQNVGSQSDSPKLLNQQPRLPPTFMFPFATGPDAWPMKWESPQSDKNLGKFSVQTGPNSIPALTPGIRNDCAEIASSPTAFQAPNQAATETTAVTPSDMKPTPAVIEAARNENGHQSKPRAPPVVGWPPIRSFRRNLASQPKLAPNAAPAPAAAAGHASLTAGVPAADPAVQTKSPTMFVKVNVEGFPIGRKIDLKAYDSYKNLSVALDEMFRGSIAAQNPGAKPSFEINEPSLLVGGDYVLVYEDDEGDRMLVGDVPWEMFVSTVKRLRVLKSSEVRGLARNRQHLQRAD